MIVPGAYTVHNTVSLVHGGAEFFSTLVQLIDRATVSCHLQTYIFATDKTGSQVVDALINAARRGVKVYLLIDGYASQGISKEFIQNLESEGVHFCWYEPLFRSKRFYFGRRLHQKVVVIDGLEALVGGINIADRYNDIDGIKAWLDYAVHIKGESVAELERLCCSIWNFSSDHKVIPGLAAETAYDTLPEQQRCTIRVRRNDWVRRKRQIWKSYFELLNQSAEHVTIMCSYFLPGLIFRRQMAKAVKRGVRMQIIMAGQSDVMVAKYAERYLYKWLLKNNIEIYEYQKNVLHAKVAVKDGKWMTIGSYNVNSISTYASIELNIDIRNRLFARNMQQELDQVIANDCIRITEENYNLSTGILKSIAQRAAYEFIKIAFYMFTFYFRQEKE